MLQEITHEVDEEIEAATRQALRDAAPTAPERATPSLLGERGPDVGAIRRRAANSTARP